MSYDISLMDPVTNRVAEVPGHLMIGGTYAADYHPETGTFTPALNINAEINITYNYSHYYYETYKDLGIRAIYGITGLDSMLNVAKYVKDDDMKRVITSTATKLGLWMTDEEFDKSKFTYTE